MLIVLAGGELYPTYFDANISSSTSCQFDSTYNITYTTMSDGITTVFGGSLDTLMSKFCSSEMGKLHIVCSCYNAGNDICTEQECYQS